MRVVGRRVRVGTVAVVRDDAAVHRVGVEIVRLCRWCDDRDREEDERRGEEHRQRERAPERRDEHDRGEGDAGQADARGAFG